jgi:hypothetical protein
MLSGRRKKDYAAEAAAQALETQAELMGIDPAGGDDFAALSADDDETDETDEVEEPEEALVAA